jgi:hypothetical protein
VAEELKTIHIDEHMKTVTLGIKDLYVNLRIEGILQTAKFWLIKHNNTNTTIEQTLQLLETILKQTISNTITNYSDHKKESPWAHQFLAP